jgi:protoporphyrin/coproporphyrin ferrochelatase
LARIISATRAKKVRNHYAEIGGKSPILEFTQRQARALEDELSRVVKTRVFVAMRYWHPLTEEAVRAVESFAPDELVLLPLYPQYSRTTTGSSLNEWNRQMGSSALRQIPTRIIREFYSDANYLHSLSTQIDKSLSNFPPGEEVHLVFSAHSVPVSVIERGDPYQMQIESTVERLLKLGRWRLPNTLCYQSKVGASKWLQPSLHSTLKTLGERGTRNVLVVPVAFVSDHVETLSEINIEAREEAAHHGIHQFELMAGLNDDPGFIRALAGLVLGEAVPLGVKVAEIVGS